MGKQCLITVKFLASKTEHICLLNTNLLVIKLLKNYKKKVFNSKWFKLMI